MKKFSISNVRRVHFIGIGGVGISALARLMLHEKKKVSGTNDNPSPETLDGLRKQDVKISLDQDPTHLPKADLYIYSDAWLTMNPALIKTAKRKGVPVLSYYQTLGEVTKQYFLIAIAGTHGKTTTTAMLIDILEEAGKDPTAIVGSLRIKTKSNFRAGQGKYFIAEADEYQKHFLNLTPKILAITNIDADHLDYYKNLKDIQNAFSELVSKIPESGFLVCNPTDSKIRLVLKSVKCQIIDYTKIRKKLKLKFPGQHNIENAKTAFAVAKVLGIPEEKIITALKNYQGVWRRFELKGKNKTGALIYDDYAHHPTEIKTTLKAFREKFPNKKLVVVFQPHLFSRTKLLLNEFARSFEDVDKVILAPIYKAREEEIKNISSKVLAEKIKQKGKNVLALENFEKIVHYLIANTGKNDVIITMGAGDIYKVGEGLI